MEIIFFAAIAFFIFYKLSKEFGKVDENERAEIQKKVAQRREMSAEIKRYNEEKKALQVVGESSTIIEEKYFIKLNQADRKNFLNILDRSKITAEFFVNGAKSAFEMILKAFASEDVATLKFLLSEKIYQGFETAINQRKQCGETLVTNLISIEKAEVISAMLFENLASVVVRIVSKQINYIADGDNKILEGKKDEISEVTDVWTLKRDLTSESPNWVVSATNS